MRPGGMSMCADAAKGTVMVTDADWGLWPAEPGPRGTEGWCLLNFETPAS
jgi:hypothetical protein